MSTPKYDSLEIDGLKYKTQLTDKFIHRKQWEKPDPGAVITYIPGSIIDLYVKEGQEVKAGDLLCLLEAALSSGKLPHHNLLPAQSLLLLSFRRRS